MVNWTDRHFLYLLRLISKKCMLYTEMTVARSYRASHLQKVNSLSLPVGLQLAGNNPDILSVCAQHGADMGYSEINLNIGCPSPRALACGIGVAMMLEPERLADCFDAVKRKVSLPVTIKCRTGIGEHEDYAFLYHFVSRLYAAGCKCFIIHARKAVPSLKSARKNRTYPELSYSTVFNLKRDFPEIEIILNGGIQTVEKGLELLSSCDGVMSGRAVCRDPLMLADVDHLFYRQEKQKIVTGELVQMYLEYLAKVSFSTRESVYRLLKPLLILLKGRKGAKAMRRFCAGIPSGSCDARDFRPLLSKLSTIAGRIMEPNT